MEEQMLFAKGGDDYLQGESEYGDHSNINDFGSIG
jgi:hypothetical protein